MSRHRLMPLWGCSLLVLVGWGMLASDARPAPAPLPRMRDRDVEFRMEQVPWKRVLLWIVEQTRKPVIAGSLPTGTFTYRSPSGLRLTRAQIMEVIKTALLAQEPSYLLIERERNFLVVPADEKVDPALILPPP